MAEEQTIDSAIIKKTQESLGKYVKRPPLTEKLLKKPPFRFLQDVVNAVIKETGKLNGLYTKLELSAEGITDRNAKIAFLQKLIDVLKIVSKENITARPSKIVAGHEPEKTNELLQTLGICLDKNLDFKSAIEQVIVGEKKDESKKTVKDVKEIKANKSNEQIDSSRIKIKSKDKDSNKTHGINKKDSQQNINKKDSQQNINKKDSTRSKTKVVSSNKTSPNDKESKSKKVTKSSSVESLQSEKKEQKISPLSKKSKELEQIKENKIEIEKQDISITEIKNKTEIETLKVDPQILLDHVDINSSQTENNNDSNDQQPVESKQKASMSPMNENKKTSDRSKKNFELSDQVMANNEVIKNDLNSNIDVEKSPNSIKLKEKRKSSSKNRKINKSDSTSDGNNLNLQNEISTQHQNSIPEERKFHNNKVETPLPEAGPVKRQSTFTREESKDSLGRPRTSLRPPSVRPPSARPGAPRRRDKNVEIVLQPNDQIKMAGIQLKVESFNNELEDDGENLVIIESENTNETNQENNSKAIITQSEEIEADENLQQGHLVQQILETQKELVQNHEQKEIKEEDLDITTLQTRKSSAKQMNSLRDIIQSLTRSVNPLGKLMDFIPEDMDAMQLEINMWRDLYSQTFIELKKEKSLTESAIEPMKNQLTQINTTIKDYIEMIDESRGKILQNSEKIFQLLTD